MKCKRCGEEMVPKMIDGEKYYVCDDCKVKRKAPDERSYYEEEKQKKKKKKGSCLKTVLIAFLVLIVIGVAGTMLGKDDSSDSSSVANSEGDSSANDASEESVITVGSSFENNGLKVTVNSYNPDYTGYSEYMQPNSGNKYIEVQFTYENVGSSGDKYVSIYDCDCYADNTACDQAYLGDSEFVNANISPGRNVSFPVYYQVPVSAESIELEYKELSLWSDNRVVIKLQ